jgi:hypothetical protein
MPELWVGSCEWLEYRFHQELRRFDRVARFGTPSLALPLGGGGERDDRMVVGRRVETLAAELLADRGYPVQLTSHKKAWDLYAGGAHVEVKAARWHPSPKGGRYQVAIRNHRADLVLMACVGEDGQVWAWFVIPGQAIGHRRNLAIWSVDPRAYGGQWAPYLEAWDIADRVIAAAGPFPAQLLLPLSREQGVGSRE